MDFDLYIQLRHDYNNVQVKYHYKMFFDVILVIVAYFDNLGNHSLKLVVYLSCFEASFKYAK